MLNYVRQVFKIKLFSTRFISETMSLTCIFCISDTSNSLFDCSKNFKKKIRRLENFMRMSLKALANEDTLLPTQMFARAGNICCGHKFCVRDSRNVCDFVQKHFVSATNVSQFAQHGNTTFILCPARLRAQETS